MNTEEEAKKKWCPLSVKDDLKRKHNDFIKSIKDEDIKKILEYIYIYIYSSR